MAFIAGFLLSGKKCKRLYGPDYGPNFCVYAVDMILLVIIGALLASQAFVVRQQFGVVHFNVLCNITGILVSSRGIGP